MDVTDLATEREERDRAIALQDQARRAAKAAAFVDGECANCGECLPAGLHFCCAPGDDCRAQYERRAAAQARNGAPHA